MMGGVYPKIAIVEGQRKIKIASFIEKTKRLARNIHNLFFTIFFLNLIRE